MDNSPLEATQPLTQPYFDPRRLGMNNSDVSEHDASDVICILAPNSPLAHDAVLATMISAPQHILQNDDLQAVSPEDLSSPRFAPGNPSRDIALRISSLVKNPSAGFVFGRNKGRCDVLLVDDEEEKSVSNVHFKVFFNPQGILMLQDTSTNGTIVDDNHLRCKDRQGVRQEKPAMRMIDNGALITVVGKDKAEIKFLVRTPKRGDYEGDFLKKLNKFLSTRDKSQVSVSATSRQNTYGMHWHGGSQYNVVGFLGKGAFATVYRLATTLEGIPFAAKELDKRRFIKNGVLDLNVDNEIKIMKGLRHPNIVQYIDFHDYDQWVYIIMEYVPHGELSRCVADQGPIPEEQARIITRQILHALDYLHRRNITHRDIKPDNILIASWEPLIVKLSDFGLSKCVNDEETFLKTFCGTLLYCAPEVYPEYASYQLGENRKRRRVAESVRKASPYDQSVDMWSFGAVLFHVMCGKAPIMGRGDNKGAQMLNNIMTKDVDFGPLRSHGISEEAIDFIGKLLNRNPLMRPTEKDCLRHPWIRDVPDSIDYMDEDDVHVGIHSGLEPVEELEEDFLDDEEEGAYQALFGLPEVPNDSPLAVDTDRLNPQYQAKRRRLSADGPLKPQSLEVADGADVVYPELPETEIEQNTDLPRTENPTWMPAPRPDRLFGEITPSVLESSGVLGQAAPPQADVPALRDSVEQVSVNDFVTFNTAEAPQIHEANSEQQLQYPQTLPLPALPSSAPSLFGAEAQIGLLNMASPDTGASEGTSPGTTNPLTPKTREVTPSASEGNSQSKEPAVAEAPSASPPNIIFSPFIDLEELEDEAAHAASMRAREASRAWNREQKAKTFKTNAESAYYSVAGKPAGTVDAARENEAGAVATGSVTNRTTRFEQAQSPSSYYSTDSTRDGFAKPLPRLGKLSPLPGSAPSATIYLGEQMTSWGRDPRSRVGCNIVHADKNDVRVPKRALHITFWAPGIEERVQRGEDWMKVSGICTILSTSTSHCIWVNDVALHAESKEGDARLYGKIYTGDIITIFQSQDAKEGFLKFRVEIGYGASAAKRPEKEAGFEVKRETVQHQMAKSMRASRKENNSDPAIGGAA